MVVSSIAVLYIIFSLLTIFAFGIFSPENPHGIQTLITQSLPQTQIFIWCVEIAFIFNLIFSYPLVIFPANSVIEGYLYKGWPKTKKRQICKNVNRAVIIILSIVVAEIVWNSLDKFLSVSGALTCTPIAFILPTMFHYRGCAET